jgi:hypothetical protein
MKTRNLEKQELKMESIGANQAYGYMNKKENTCG